jgi:hypothetical protein
MTSRSGGSFAARTCIASARVMTVIPPGGSGTVRGAHQVGAGLFPATSNSIRRAMSLMISSPR